MDTPSLPPPRDEAEKDVLEKLVIVRDKLLLLKKDRKTYMQKQHVLPLYRETIDQVRRLNQARSASQGELDENIVDRVLDSCFQLLSLSFMTIGQNNTAPAAYALTSTIKRLLDHLAEVDLFSAKDLESITETLNLLVRNVERAPADTSPYLITLLTNRLETCKRALASLCKRLDRLQEPLPQVHEKLISILRSISAANTRSKFSSSDVKNLRDQLKEISANFRSGAYKTPEGEYPAGSEEIDALLRKCLLWADIVLERRGVIPESFKSTYDVLVRMRNDLEKLSITSKWALREADLYDYQRQLDRIDESRVDGNWLDEDGNKAELYVQRTLLYLVRRSYGYIYFLMISSNPVSEALQPVFNQLQTLKKCLIEVKNSGGVSSIRELYPYSLKVNSIDNMRVDGKFMFNGDIPEGQGSVNELLAECYELCYELRVDLETRPAQDDDTDEDEDSEAVEGPGTSEAEAEELAASLADTTLEPRRETQTRATV
ncbi:hypothetical protein SODALDRAFT_270443 [Sodiomyces alkalinus F11]|uniref:Uncharacterized protein n=1 Tax=Sodiomyces alkalinus (strain CBS 110278 / VKM F-3762 / F11) TaxID=1314773 RepID=A0A3N2Q436_SODAK|nr:hypothetical protein SODALDRAFT_270443 [Sodiomyces alkalinus F11]ROT41520.1 hypothetical protein SODALDRAFT_270443 [Sodiomyces alkalinus F11]